MSEYNNSNIECEYADDDEITLGELFGHIFNHFLLIVIVTLAFTLLGVVFATLKTREYSVSATLSITEPYGSEVIKSYGGKVYTSENAVSDILSKESIEKALTATSSSMSYEEASGLVKYEKKSKGDGGSVTYRIYTSNTSSPDYWKGFLTVLLNSKMNSAPEAYIEEGGNVKKMIEESIRDYEEILSSDTTLRESSFESLALLKKDLRAVDGYINSLDTCIAWNESITLSDESTSKTLIVVIFFLAGGVIGVIASLALGFSDRHIYTSKTLKKIAQGRLVSSIPLYRNAEDIDKREFEYIVSKLGVTDENKIALLSLSPKAGNLTLEKGLKGVTKAEIENLGILSDNPSVLRELSRASFALVVLRAGIDDSVRIEKLISDIEAVGAENYGFVLNCTDVSDSDVTVYLSKEKYRHHHWLLESWKSYYRKNY